MNARTVIPAHYKLKAVFLMLVLVVSSGCPVSNKPAPAASSTDTSRMLAVQLDRLSLLIKQSREARDQLLQANLLDKQEALDFTHALIYLNNAGLEFNNQVKIYYSNITLAQQKLNQAEANKASPQDIAALQAAYNDAAIGSGKIKLQTFATAILAAGQHLLANGTFHVKNPDARAKFQAILASLDLIIQTLTSFAK